MLIDAHCHPFDLVSYLPNAEEERRRMGVLAASSACDLEEFEYCQELAVKAQAEGAALIFPCFAVHPQQMKNEKGKEKKERINENLIFLDKLAAEGRIAGVGECGFDLFNDAFRETEKEQDRIFAAHLEIAHEYDLPVVLHQRRAMHKIFACTKNLTKCRAAVFHCWAGTYDEGASLLRRGVNAYFSFGNSILNGHKKAMKSCALFPADRILTETDSPFQPAYGADFSSWADLSRIIEMISSLRREAGNEAAGLETQIEANFKAVFCS